MYSGETLSDLDPEIRIYCSSHLWTLRSSGIVIAGCTQPSSPAPITTTPVAASTTLPGMANPASVNCGNVGGTTQIMTNPDGSQYGMCTFTNGTSCEEWALFRGEGCKDANVSA